MALRLCYSQPDGTGTSSLHLTNDSVLNDQFQPRKSNIVQADSVAKNYLFGYISGEMHPYVISNFSIHLTRPQ